MKEVDALQRGEMQLQLEALEEERAHYRARHRTSLREYHETCALLSIFLWMRAPPMRMASTSCGCMPGACDFPLGELTGTRRSGSAWDRLHLGLSAGSLPRLTVSDTAPSLIPTVHGNTVRSFPYPRTSVRSERKLDHCLTL
jgi:hypothetical protein